MKNADLTTDALADFDRRKATSQDGSVQPRYAATWRGVMQVDLIQGLTGARFLDKPLSPHEVVHIL